MLLEVLPQISNLGSIDQQALHSELRYPLPPAGFDVLTAMERVPVNTDDRPEQEVKITGAEVFVNPYKEMEEEEQKKVDAERRKVWMCTDILT